MKKLYVYSFPRSGSNLFASYLNRHPNIFSINTGGGRIRDIPDDEILASLVSPLETFKDYSIFANGVNYVKEEIEWVLFDEINPRHVTPDIKGIALLRSLESINKSINSFSEKLKSPWISEVSEGAYNALVDVATKPYILGIQTETFILHPEQCIDLVKKHLDLDFFPTQDQIIAQGCKCGTAFTTTETDKIEGEVFKHDSPQTFYYCPQHKSVLSAWGGTNPYSPLDPGKVDQSEDWSVETMNEKLSNVI